MRKGGRILTEEQTTKLTREQLYYEIWKISVAGVAKKYNASYDELLRLCKETDIPIPPSGYWIKLKFGKPVTHVQLPESSIVEVALPTNPMPKRIRKTPPAAVEAVTEEKSPDHEDVKDQQSEIETPTNFEDNYLTSYRTVSDRYNTYTREKLYQEVWAKPVVEVAVQYGVSDVTIHKICKTLNVPVPPRGYWAKVRAGAKIEKTPLPQAKGITKITGARTFQGVKSKVGGTSVQPLMFLPESEREKVLLAAQEMKMPDENAKLHKKIIAYKAVIKEWNKKDNKPEDVRRRFSSYLSRPPFLAGVISDKSLLRVYRILDALFRQVESLGGSINDDLSLQVRNEHVTLEIAEAQDEVKHEITKQEARALIVYEDEKRHHSWASKPQIRKYDYLFNGRLRINIRQGRYFRDTDKINIESRLGDMLIELYEESEVVRIDREAREEATRKREEEARQKEERRKRYDKEVELTIALENEALDFETACRIRAYVKAVVTSYGQDSLDDETSAWVDWAMKKADWFEPIACRDDEIFGEREHEKSPEEKVLKKAGYY